MIKNFFLVWEKKAGEKATEKKQTHTRRHIHAKM